MDSDTCTHLLLSSKSVFMHLIITEMHYCVHIIQTEQLTGHHEPDHYNRMTTARIAVRNMTRLLCRTEITPMKLSCSRNYVAAVVNPTDAALYKGVFPEIIDEMVAIGTYGKHSPETQFSRDHFRKALNYNTQFRNDPESARLGVWLVDCYKHLMPNATEQNLKPIRMLAWLCEIWPRYLTIADDVIQDRRVRDKQPAWHTQNANEAGVDPEWAALFARASLQLAASCSSKIEVSLMGLHDAVLLQNTVYEVIKNHFSQIQHYTDMMDLLHESAVRLITGQEERCKTPYSQFSQNKLDHINRLMSGTLCQLPLRLVMYTAGLSDASEHKDIKEIGLSFGQWHQEQDDMTNCYGQPDEVGSDISDNICTWPIVRALEKADAHQKQILQDNYGQKNSNSVTKVLDVYNQLNLRKDAQQHQTARHEGMMSLINGYKGVFSKSLLADHANYMLNRKYV